MSLVCLDYEAVVRMLIVDICRPERHAELHLSDCGCDGIS